MAIVAFNFTKINVEKKKSVDGKINITNNVTITDVQAAHLSLGKNKQEGLRFSFEFNSKYEPGVGHITLKGDVVSIESDENTKKILDDWKKDKKIKKEHIEHILNQVLSKCNIQALILSKDINLPPPIKLPRIQENGTK